MTDFETSHEYQIDLAPAPLRKKWGARWIGAIGLVKDGFGLLARAAVDTMLVDNAPADALSYIGQERGDLERAPLESDAGYRARLKNAWEDWAKADSDLGIVDALKVLGLTARVKRNNCWNVDGNPGNVTGYWARFWVIIDPTHQFARSPVAGTGTLCGSVLCGISSAVGASNAQVQADVARIVRVVRKWQGSHSKFMKLIIRFPSSGKLCGDGVQVDVPAASPKCGEAGLKADSISAFIET